MLKIEQESEGDLLILRLIGRAQSKHIRVLRTQIGSNSQKLALDLAEVTLVNRDVVSFFGLCEAAGIELRNCPSYIRAWTHEEQEKDGDYT